MHELSLTQEILEIVASRAGQSNVRRVVLEIGVLSGVLPDAIRFSFDICKEGSSAADAILEILEPEGLARCRTCSREFPITSPLNTCPCGSMNLEWLAGTELRIIRMEISECAQPADALTT